jgi:hypothetical protein
MRPVYDYNSGDPYIGMSGSYENKSKYIRVANVLNTINYLDEAGNIRVAAATASLPAEGSGSFAGGLDGSLINPMTFYENITETNSQGFNPLTCQEYTAAIDILSNQDEYDINMIFTPGVLATNTVTANTFVEHCIDACEARGDCFYIFDTAVKSTQTLTSVTSPASLYDSSYAATY